MQHKAKANSLQQTVWERGVNLQAKNAINKNSFYSVFLQARKEGKVYFLYL